MADAHRGVRAFIPPSLFQFTLPHLELALFRVGLRQGAWQLPHGDPPVPGVVGQKPTPQHQPTMMRATSREPVVESRPETHDFSTALTTITFYSTLWSYCIFSLCFLPLISPRPATAPGSSCHLWAIYIPSLIIKLCHFLKTAQPYTRGKCFILIQESLKCLHVCLPEPAECHWTTALAYFYSLYEKASASWALWATGFLQAPKLCPIFHHWFFFSPHTVIVFHEKKCQWHFLPLSIYIFGKFSLWKENNASKSFILKTFIAGVSLRILGFISNTRKTVFEISRFTDTAVFKELWIQKVLRNTWDNASQRH